MSQFSACDHMHMADALRLAEAGLFTTQPNPRVGCVIAQGDRVIGSGFHRRAGEAHAEVYALAQAGLHARGASAYVTLEPCAHQGRTGPCADALINAGIARVVVACEDPFDQVDGRGLARLCAAGVKVEVGLMHTEARELNIGFFSRIERGRPFVRIKLAASLDGRTALADGSSNWITTAAARNDGHRWRARASALLTGIGTVLADDPQLTVRISQPHAQMLRVVLDSDLRMPLHARMLKISTPLLIYTAAHADPQRRAALEKAGVELFPISAVAGRLDLMAVLVDLARRGVNELHVEAGATVSGALVAAKLADELLIYQHACLLGDAARPLLSLSSPAWLADRIEWKLKDVRQIGEDWRLRLRPAAKEQECSPD
ncbi:MAG: bifunctional diaminohydroxyphosphoribosylaminopyrimidine deaminase/5-amino-6-(5-phosphoribosylamino)uracil reductase RibD [Pseudomonadota bacterium]|nr:bifunctional diaminohydroxyphosphoribosylaminopyrimidine deaminase/5-amino-6-(5-phosphoribosylamino)uracil reductase RibD [Pseudomonadota bacterium]